MPLSAPATSSASPQPGTRPSATVFLALVSFYASLIIPLTTYRSYVNEFSSSPLTIFLSLLAISGITFVLLLACHVVVPKALRTLLGRFILVGVAFGWYNYNCLDYRGKIMGLDYDVFLNSYSMTERLVFVAVAAVLVFSKITDRLTVTAMVLISTAGLVNLAFVDEQPAERTDSAVNLPRELFAYSSDLNVLHIVLDGMQSTLFSELLDAEPRQREAFDGFYMFPDTLTSSDITYLSVASFLSGEAFDGSEGLSPYRLRTGVAAPRGSQPPGLPPLHEELRKNNFDLDVLTGCPQCLQRRRAYRTFVSQDFSGIPSLKRDLLKLLDFTLLRVLPWRLKPILYRDGMPYFSAWAQGDEGRSNRAVNFIQNYGSTVSTSNPRKTYKLLHLLTPHGPWTTGPHCEPRKAETSGESIRFQGLCAAKSLSSLFDSLKSAGIYDKTIIVIHGDHGICLPDGLPSQGASFPECIGNTNPLLLFKPLGQRGPLVSSPRSAALTDLPKTILDLAGISNSLRGESILAQEFPQERARFFFTFQPDRTAIFKRGAVETSTRYTVKGPLFDAASWRD